jgi:hypothetical protein
MPSHFISHGLYCFFVPTISHSKLSTILLSDFWNTRGGRCPDALDKLDNMANDPKYENVNCISICCDKLDGAQDIIEKEDDPRWRNMILKSKDHSSKIVVQELLRGTSSVYQHPYKAITRRMDGNVVFAPIRKMSSVILLVPKIHRTAANYKKHVEELLGGTSIYSRINILSICDCSREDL